MTTLNALERELRRRHARAMLVFGGIFFCLLVSIFISAPAYAYGALSECNAEGADELAVDIINANSDSLWVYYVGGEDEFDGKCLLYTGNGSDRELVKNDQTSADDYNYFDTTGISSQNCYYWTGTGFTLTNYLEGNDCNRSNANPVSSTKDSCDIADGTCYQSNMDLYADLDGGLGIDYFGATGTYDQGDLIRAASGELSTFVTLTGSGSIITLGESVTFTVEWQNLDFQPYYLYFYEDVEETTYIPVVINYPLGSPGGTGSWEFTYEYSVADTYLPFVRLGNSSCSVPTADGCSLEDDAGNVITVNSVGNLDQNYDNILTFSKYNDVLVNEVLTYQYDIDTDICEPSTVTGATLIRGYTDHHVLSATGVTLDLFSGTGSIYWPKTNQPYSDFVYPYIQVDCTDGSERTIYAGSTMVLSRAVGVSLYDELDLRFWFPTDPVTGNIIWLGGGQSSDFSYTGSGYLFQSSKLIYQRFEPVKMKWVFNPSFTVGSVVLYHDPDQLDTVSVFTDASDLTKNANHYAQIEYSNAGEYYPMLQVRSDAFDAENPATFVNVYLGGESSRDVRESIIVTSTVFSASNFQTTRGIFGLSPDVFRIEVGDNANIFIKGLTGVANLSVGGLVWLASKAYSILEDAPVFDFLTNIVRPAEGQTKILPSAMYGMSLDLSDFDRTFTINYADSGSANAIFYNMMLFILGVSVMFYVIRKVF